MAKTKIYVDGQEGTTGLEINQRLKNRDDVEILKIDSDKLFDVEERRKYINQADIVFLCLPDEVAIQSVSLIERDNLKTRVIDASTAHRTADGWVYGIPELSAEHRENIKNAKRLANPGCYPTGFICLIYPLVREKLLSADYPLTCHAVTGYSGGGVILIDKYESEENKEKFNSPCFYGLGLAHKHTPEMQKHSGITNPPIFSPIVANYYRGMTVAVPLHADKLGLTAHKLQKFYADYYTGQHFVKVMPPDYQNQLELGFLNAESCNNTNNLEILVFGGEEQVLLVARLDNLGKGASGAAVQNMNIMLGLDETIGS